jgi:hypothetical protein
MRSVGETQKERPRSTGKRKNDVTANSITVTEIDRISHCTIHHDHSSSLSLSLSLYSSLTLSLSPSLTLSFSSFACCFWALQPWAWMLSCFHFLKGSFSYSARLALRNLWKVELDSLALR